MAPRFTNNLAMYFQIGNGVELLKSNSDQIEINTTGMSPCILTTAPSDCTSGGATYMFWIKLLDGQRGPILSTQDWSNPRKGIRIMGENDGKLKVTIFRQGTTSNRFKGEVLVFNNYIDSWLHVAVVWQNDPRFEIYFNVIEQIVTQGTQYTTSGSSHVTLESRMRMKLGAQYVTFSNTIKTKNMILDNLMLFDKPLTQADIVTCA